jgi:hypothetical protein
MNKETKGKIEDALAMVAIVILSITGMCVVVVSIAGVILVALSPLIAVVLTLKWIF